MTDIIATAVILVCVGATFCATCYAIARFAYFDRRARADLLLAFYCVVVFAGAVVGCLAFTEAYGNVVSAAFAALLCGCSAAVGALLRKTWAQADELERRRVEDLRGLVDRYRTEEGSIESRCAHAARTFDLTRREEEVLALLPAPHRLPWAGGSGAAAQGLHPFRDRARVVRIGRYGEDSHPQPVPQNGRNGKGRACSGDRGKRPCLGLPRPWHLIAE